MTRLEDAISSALAQRGVNAVEVKIEDGRYVVLAVSKRIVAKIEQDKTTGKSV